MTENPLYISLFVSIIMIVIAILVKAIFFKKSNLRIYKSLFFTALILFPISVYLLYFQFIEFENRTVQKSWPTTLGTITQSRTIGERAIRPLVVYRFKVDSVIFTDSTSLNAPMFGGKRKKLDVAEKLVKEYPVGKAVEVFYNPDNPQESYITHQITWDILAKLGFYAFLILFSSFCLMLPRKSKGSSA